MKFLFTNNKDILINIIKNAEEFIKIIAFQFTSREFVDLLIEKSKLGLIIELITLPVDSYSKEEERSKIKNLFNELLDNNIKIYFCDWEVGDPSLTTTSMSGRINEGGGNKWYSLHGKLLITEQAAILMSFNFIDRNLFESFLITEGKNIAKFLELFDKCKNLFISPTKIKNINGKIIDKINENEKREIINNYLKTGRKLIRDYPPELTPEKNIVPGLHLAPFDGRLRKILYDLINSSKKFLYLVSESLLKIWSNLDIESDRSRKHHRVFNIPMRLCCGRQRAAAMFLAALRSALITRPFTGHN